MITKVINTCNFGVRINNYQKNKYTPIHNQKLSRDTISFSGNAPQKEWFIRQLKEATERGIIIVNITQCSSGAVEMERYETGMHLLEAGVISGYDSTPECAITKLMFLLGHELPNKEIRNKMDSCLIGEITKS